MKSAPKLAPYVRQILFIVSKSEMCQSALNFEISIYVVAIRALLLCKQILCLDWKRIDIKKLAKINVQNFFLERWTYPAVEVAENVYLKVSF